jgi:hypothetical protein
MNCKHGIATGGDIVPYGMSGAQLPDFVECDNPNVPEEEIDDLPCDESCPYFEACDDEVSGSMFVETRFLDSGKAQARINKSLPEPQDAHQGEFDYYCEKLDGTLRGWILNNLTIKASDELTLITSLDSGEWDGHYKFHLGGDYFGQ